MTSVLTGRWRPMWRPDVEPVTPTRRTYEGLDLFLLCSRIAELGTERLLEAWRAAGEPGLRLRHFTMMNELVDGALSVGDVSRRLRITQQAASKTLSELAAGGYVERSGDDADLRRRPTSLTASGRALVMEGRRARSELAEEMTTDLCARSQWTELSELTTNIRGMLVAHDAAPTPVA